MKATALCLGLMALGADARIRDLAKKLRKAERKGGSSVTLDVSPGSSTTVNRTTTEEDYWKQWNDFQDMTGNNYLTQSEHDDRYEIFKDNIDKINRHNAQGLSWWLGVTQFADMTADEFKEKIVGVKDDKPACTFDENRESNEYVFEDTSNNPDSVDWVEKGVVTPVKNQGQCGSCWAFSTTGALEARYAIKTGKLNSLSEQELVDCAGAEGNNGCKGGLMDYGFDYVQQEHGLCLESDFPYEAKTQTFDCDRLRSACQHYDPISGHQDVQKNDSDQLETALAQGPVSIAIEADQTTFQLYKGGVLKGRCGHKLDHGVLAVGYDNTGADHYWKVKNSWGSTWGEQGYIRLCKDCNANCQFGRCAGQCGILGQPSFPVV